MKRIYTIGHSNRSIDDFIAMLNTFGIQQLADIRNFPGSRKFPWFNKENLEISLRQSGIGYVHIKALGGRRAPRPDSKNIAWNVPAFRGYADYMETPDFNDAITRLEAMALQSPTAYMCSEALWWSCHRALVSDYLKFNGWEVIHIMSLTKATPHTYTAPARVIDDHLSYGLE